MQGVEVEREAARLLPDILAPFFGDDSACSVSAPENKYDLVVKPGGRRWAAEVKSSGTPGTMATAA